MKLILTSIYLFTISFSSLLADNQILARIIVSEEAGIDRSKEYVECSLQLDAGQLHSMDGNWNAQDMNTGEVIPCQIVNHIKTDSLNISLIQLIFPVSILANQTKAFGLKVSSKSEPSATDLKISGENLDLIIENKFYRADLTKNPEIEPQSYDSGQIRELFVKLGFNELLTNAEDRVHWAPNFKKPELEWYTTIAHWQSPDQYQVFNGPYLVETRRKGPAPDHPQIMLTAVYKFYADQPYFRFYSDMEMTDDIWLELLRNDEMTMDSMFTDLAFQRPTGHIVDVAFTDRHELLETEPIENTAPWICFYNKKSGMAFGSIRIKYDISNQFGGDSPVYRPHTQIGEWLAGIKYWNRRLIHDQLTYVPKGSRYREENVYLVFSINDNDKFDTIMNYTDQLRNPLRVAVKTLQ